MSDLPESINDLEEEWQNWLKVAAVVYYDGDINAAWNDVKDFSKKPVQDISSTPSRTRVHLLATEKNQ